MQRESASVRLFHLLARYTYLQDLLENQRVLVIGKAEATSADALESQGIRRAVFIDSSERRVTEATRRCSARKVEFMVGPLARVALVEDSFDVCIIEDFGLDGERSHLLSTVKRGLTSAGILVAAIPNPDASLGLTSGGPAGLGYYEFYGQLADSFPFVRMIGQCPLVGFALADLAVDDPEASITFDSSLLAEGSEDAEFFVALCSRSPINADPFAVVQVPLQWVDVGRLSGEKGPDGAPQQEEKDQKPAAGRIEVKPKPEAEPAPAKAAKPRDDSSRRERDKRSRQRPAPDSEELGRLKNKSEEADKEISRLRLELDKRAVSIAKLENHLREAREKASAEHDRVIQTKIALEAERKKLLGLEKEAEMGRRLQKMGPGSAPAPAPHPAPASPAVKDLEGELGKLRREIEQAGAERKKAEAERKKAESRASDAESRAGRADVLSADLARERGARRLAEAQVSELEKKLKEAKQQGAPKTPATRVNPTAEALRKAEAMFGGSGDKSEQIAALEAELKQERQARAELEQGQGEGAELRNKLEAERQARQNAEERVGELEGKLSRAETTAARLRSQGEARMRAESFFGGAEGAPPSEEETDARLQFEQCLEAKAELERSLSTERERRESEHELRVAAEKRLDELERAPRRQRSEEGKLERAPRRQRSEEGKLEGERRRREAAEAKVERLEAELKSKLEAERRADQLTNELAQAKANLADLRRQAVAPPAETSPAEAPDQEEITPLREELAQERAKREAAEADVVAVEQGHGEEISRLERSLRERGEAVSRLEQQLAEQAQLLQRAVADLEGARADSKLPVERDDSELASALERLQVAERAAAKLERQLEERDQALAELTGELQGHKWRIAELELSGPTAASPQRSEEAIARKVRHAPAGGEGGVELALARAEGKVEVLEREQRRNVAELESVRASLSEVQRHADRLELETREATRREDEAKRALVAAEERHGELKSDASQASTRAAAMERKAAEAVGQLNVFERELETCRRQRLALEEELGEARHRLGTLSAQRREAEAQLADLQREITEVRAQAAESSRDLAAAQACMAMLEEQLPGVSDVLDGIRTGDTAELPAVREPVRWGPPLVGTDPTSTEADSLRRQLQELREELEQAKAREEALQVRFDQSEGSASSREERAAALEAKCAELGQELAAAKDRTAQLTGELAQAQAAAELAQGELNELREQSEASSLEAARLSASVETLEADLKKASLEAEQHGAELAAAERQVTDLRTARNEARAELERARATIAELEAGREAEGDDESSIAGLQRLLTSCRREVARQEGVALGLGFKVRDLEARLESARARPAVASPAGGDPQPGRLEELQAELERVTAAHAAERERVEELKATLRETRARARQLEFVSERVDEWADRFERSERQTEELRVELEEARAALAASAAPAEPGEDRAALEARIVDLEQARRDAEDALERVIDGFSEVSGDAAALIELLSAREDLIERLRANVTFTAASCVEDEAGGEADGGRSTSSDAADTRRQLDSSRRVIEALEADKRRLSDEIDQLRSEGEEQES